MKDKAQSLCFVGEMKQGDLAHSMALEFVNQENSKCLYLKPQKICNLNVAKITLNKWKSNIRDIFSSVEHDLYSITSLMKFHLL